MSGGGGGVVVVVVAAWNVEVRVARGVSVPLPVAASTMTRAATTTAASADSRTAGCRHHGRAGADAPGCGDPGGCHGDWGRWCGCPAWVHGACWVWTKPRTGSVGGAGAGFGAGQECRIGTVTASLAARASSTVLG